jgi:hypothetical protein
MRHQHVPPSGVSRGLELNLKLPYNEGIEDEISGKCRKYQVKKRYSRVIAKLKQNLTGQETCMTTIVTLEKNPVTL